MTERWTFLDPATSETWTVPINPNTMTDPTNRQRRYQHSYQGTTNLDDARFRSLETAAPIVEWTFGGVIQTKDHHDKLEHWARKESKVHITDHLGRTFAVVMRTFEPKERRPTPAKPWRFTYEMRAYVLRRVS